MSSIPIPVKEALTVLAGACDDLSRVIKELPEAAAPVVPAEPVAALGAGEGAEAGVAVVPAEAPEAAEPVVPAEVEGAQPVVPAEAPEAAEPVVPAEEAVPGAALGNDTVIQVGGNTYVYGNIMKAFENIKNGKQTNLSKEKLDEVYAKLKNARTIVEVQNILREHNFAMAGKGANKYVQQLSGGTRKPRMHRRKKTQRKRSKTIKKKPKSGNRK
jgi:hypothetical protein